VVVATVVVVGGLFATGVLHLTGGGGPMSSRTISPPPYTATFTESGLPNGTVWSVFFNGTLFAGTNGPSFSGAIASTSAVSVSFALVNGTYPFFVGVLGCSAFSATNSSLGSPLVINGSSVTIQTTFSPHNLPIPPPQCSQQSPPYFVTFTESGLPSGVLWNVSFDGTNVSANALSFSYSVVNG
ncbi:hypothetical protein B1B_03486, partial [mine drainage metagenome]